MLQLQLVTEESVDVDAVGVGDPSVMELDDDAIDPPPLLILLDPWIRSTMFYILRM